MQFKAIFEGAGGRDFDKLQPEVKNIWASPHFPYSYKIFLFLENSYPLTLRGCVYTMNEEHSEGGGVKSWFSQLFGMVSHPRSIYGG